MNQDNNMPIESFKKPSLIKKFESDYQMFFSLENLESWERLGLIPKELASGYLEFILRNQEEHKRYEEFKKNNPNATPEEEQAFWNIPQTLTKEESFQHLQDIKMIVEINKHMLENWESLRTAYKKNTNGFGLFKDTKKSSDSFGISRLLTDPMNYIDPLIDDAVLKKTGESSYEVEGRFEYENKNDCVVLRYEIEASSGEEAIKVFDNYKSTMKGKGIKIWMAHWKLANIYGNEYECPMIDVMKLTADDSRKSSYTIKEKEEHWRITKMLRRTVISLEKKVQRYNRERTIWVEQPLLIMLGGEREEETYPEKISVRVLAPAKSPDTQNDKFFPAIYKNKTLDVHPKQALLAFHIQTRASQLKRGEKDLTLDWPFIFSLANQTATAASNIRVAKSRVRKIMEEFKNKYEIIDGWAEHPSGIIVTPKSQK